MRVSARIPVIGAVLGLALPLSAVLPARSADDKPYPIAFITDFSGPIAAYGKSLRSGFEGYVTRINAAGGVNGRKIEVTYVDDGAKPDRGALSFTNLITNNLMVAGEVLGNVCNAIVPLTNQYHVSMFCLSTSPELAVPPQPYVFDVYMNNPDWARPTVEFAKMLITQPKVRAAVVNMTLASSAAMGDALAKVAADTGWTVDRLQLDIRDPNPGPELFKIVSAKPDIIFTNTLDVQAVKLAEAMQSAGIDPPVISTGGGVGWPTLKALGRDNMYITTQYAFVDPTSSSEPAGLTQFAKDVQAVGGDPNGNYTAPGYLQAQIIVAALKSCGADCTAQKLRDSLENTRVETEGRTGSPAAGFSAASHIAVDSLSLYHWDAKSSVLKLIKAGLPASTN